MRFYFISVCSDEECSKAFKTKKAKTLHKRKHTGNFLKKCGVCDKGVFSERDFKDHVASHEDNPLYRCEVCDKGFSHHFSLTRHMEMHTAQKVVCKYCGNLVIPSRIKEHEETHNRNFPCQECPKVFTRKISLQRHCQAEHEKVAAVCPVCGKKFKYQVNLNRHIHKHHNDGK